MRARSLGRRPSSQVRPIERLERRTLFAATVLREEVNDFGASEFTDGVAAERDGRRLVVSVMDTENVPLRAADQAALLLDWGFAVSAGTPGVGRLVDSAADVPPPPRETPATRLPDRAATPVPMPVAGGGEPLLLPVGLAVVCAGVVVATLVGVRRRSGG